MSRRPALTLTNTSLRHLDVLNAMKNRTTSRHPGLAIGFTVLIERLALALRMPLRAA